MRDERGEVRGLLIVLGMVVLLAAGVFGFYRPSKSHRPTVAAVAAGVTTTTDPAAPAAALADAGAPAASAPMASPSAAATPGGAPAAPTAPRTAAPPVTSAPVTAPPATSPPATSPPATTPPTTVPATPKTCTVTMGNATPKRATALEITVASNSPRSSVSGSIAPASGTGQSYGLVGTTDDNGGATFTHQATPSDQPTGTTYKVAVTVGPTKAACSTTFTTS